MKKLLLIPTTITATLVPFITLTSCGNKEPEVKECVLNFTCESGLTLSGPTTSKIKPGTLWGDIVNDESIVPVATPKELCKGWFNGSHKMVNTDKITSDMNLSAHYGTTEIDLTLKLDQDGWGVWDESQTIGEIKLSDLDGQTELQNIEGYKTPICKSGTRFAFDFWYWTDEKGNVFKEDMIVEKTMSLTAHFAVTEDFTTDSWEVVCWYANQGIEKLKSAYNNTESFEENNNSFIDLPRYVTLNTKQHMVEVVAENQDVLGNLSGYAALTFQFANFICDENGNTLNVCYNKLDGTSVADFASTNYWDSNLPYALEGPHDDVVWFQKDQTAPSSKYHGTVYSMLLNSEPALVSNFKQVLKPVKIKQNDIWVEQEQNCSLFLPSATNMSPCNFHDYYDPEEGSTYPYYINDGEPTKDEITWRIRSQVNSTVGGRGAYHSSYTVGTTTYDIMNFSGHQRTPTSRYTMKYWTASSAYQNDDSGHQIWIVDEPGAINYDTLIHQSAGVDYVMAYPLAPCFCI